MAHDLVIRDGLIVDGTGAEAYRGDVAVDGDCIAALGEVSDKGTQEIDAEGHLITPGFIDSHTHLDAQVGWDPMLTPVSWHGITTVLIGNCGVTFAPCKPTDRGFLAGMMETVEDIPKDAILNGLPWNWESYGEYLDSVDAMHPVLNITGLIGHSAMRVYVMGERAVDEDPTADEIQQMAELAGRAVRDGAIGFSSSRLPAHVLPDGRSIPGTFAKADELHAISKTVGANGGILQFVLDYEKLTEEMALITEQGRTADTRVLFSAPIGRSGYASEYEQAMTTAKAEGIDVSGLTLPRSGGFLSSLSTGIFFAYVRWGKELRKMDFDARLEAIRNDEFRAKLIATGKAEPKIEQVARNTYWLGDSDRPHYTRNQNESLLSLAEAAGEHPVETWLRFMLDSNGLGMFHTRFFNHNLDQVRELLQADWVLPGIGDAGAHATQIIDSGWTSFMLSHWVREQGVFSIEEAVRKLTSAQARVLGMTDRGTLAAGQRADINVIDLNRLSERQPKIVHDLPGDAPRLIQKAHGYRATLCNGRVILRDDELTGDRPGRVLRNSPPS